MADTSSDLTSALPLTPQDTYTVRASIGIADDHGDTIATATQIALGQSVAGTIERDVDADAFKVTLPGGSYYTIALGNSKLAFDLNTSLAVVRLRPDGTGEPVTTEHLYEKVLFKVEQTGDYAVVIKDAGTWNGAQAYTVRAATAFADDYPNTVATGAQLAVGGTVSGKIEANGDLDVFKLSLQANHRYAFAHISPADAEVSPNGFGFGFKLLLSDADGKALASPDSAGQADQLRFTAPSTGNYFLTYSHELNSYNRTGYSLRATDITGDVRKPVLTPVKSVDLDPTSSLTLAADEFLSSKVPSGYFNGDLKLLDAAGNQLRIEPKVLDVGSHSVVSIKPFDDLKSGATYTLTVSGAALADYAGNYAAPAVYTFSTKATRLSMAEIQGTTGPDILYGQGSAGTTFYGNANSDWIFGSAAIDTSLYAGKRADYKVALGNGLITVDGPEGFDQLGSIDRLEFDDKVIVFNHTGIEGQGYRMYRAVFDREPDAAGLGFYVKLLETGYTPYTIAPFFVASPEFQGLYGSNPGNRDFVERLYHNVLHRDGEASGVNFWLDLLDRKVLTQAEVVVGFSESPENVAATATLIGQGFEYIPYGQV